MGTVPLLGYKARASHPGLQLGSEVFSRIGPPGEDGPLLQVSGSTVIELDLSGSRIANRPQGRTYDEYVAENILQFARNRCRVRHLIPTPIHDRAHGPERYDVAGRHNDSC